MFFPCQQHRPRALKASAVFSAQFNTFTGTGYRQCLNVLSLSHDCTRHPHPCDCLRIEIASNAFGHWCAMYEGPVSETHVMSFRSAASDASFEFRRIIQHIHQYRLPARLKDVSLSHDWARHEYLCDCPRMEIAPNAFGHCWAK